MAKEKSPKELGEIMSEQLDRLRVGKANADTIRTSEAIANMVGKIQRQAALEIVYSQARKQTVSMIPSLDRKTQKNS